MLDVLLLNYETLYRNIFNHEYETYFFYSYHKY